MNLTMEDALPMPLKDLLMVIQEKVTRGSTYFGIPTMKSPLDAWVYQELIMEIKPDVIIEIGTWHGGSALMLAHLCDAMGTGRVISIDKNPAPNLSHPRITWLTGDATKVFLQITSKEKVLVIEDSSHEYQQCLDVLRHYSEFISPGSYLIVEDTICGHGLDTGPRPGAYEAVQTFLAENKNFEVDRTRESYLVTWNPSGYLKRIK